MLKLSRAFFLLFLPFSLFAEPQGLDVLSGNAFLTHNGKESHLTQTTQKAIVHWKDFSIGKGETLHFIQPGRDSTTLNRVVGNNISQILGSLKANGNVILVNPHGVYIGGEGVIQTGGFIASTADISNENFLKGESLIFTDPSEGSITNAGKISCPGGDVYLIAKDVTNSGEIEGTQVLIRPHTNPRVYIQTDDLETTHPYESVITHTGTIQAYGTEEREGRIYLIADQGKTTVNGTLTAPEIQVLGKEVLLSENTHIDASGPSGGTVLVGGNYQGKNPVILNAQTTTVQAGAIVNADSTGSGDGGKVIYWSDGVTTVCGATSARGGPDGGDGGFIEVSGLKNFYYRGTNDQRAPLGKCGTILFDPDSNVTVAVGADTNMSAGPNFAPTTLEASLSGGNVTLTTANAGGTKVGGGEPTPILTVLQGATSR